MISSLRFIDAREEISIVSIYLFGVDIDIPTWVPIYGTYRDIGT